MAATHSQVDHQSIWRAVIHVKLAVRNYRFSSYLEGRLFETQLCSCTCKRRFSVASSLHLCVCVCLLNAFKCETWECKSAQCTLSDPSSMATPHHLPISNPTCPNLTQAKLEQTTSTGDLQKVGHNSAIGIKFLFAFFLGTQVIGEKWSLLRHVEAQAAAQTRKSKGTSNELS